MSEAYRDEPLFSSRCAIDGCEEEGVNVIGVRCRRTDTSAAWAPNTSALLCEEHSGQGIRVELRLTQIPEPYVELAVAQGDGFATRRTLLRDA